MDPLGELAAAAQEGDDGAVTELVRRTQPAVWRLCRTLGSVGVADDLTQETYLRALRSLTSFRGEAPVQAWLLSIARRVCADHVRTAQRRRRLTERLRQMPVDVPAPSPSSVEELVQHLAIDRREAFTLTQILGLSYDEAAHVIGCPIGTVRSRVARARADLLTALQQTEAL